MRGDKPIIRDGYMHLTEAPGLGVELDDEMARHHLHTPMSERYV